MAIGSVKKVRFYANSVKSGQKLHMMLGHQTALAKLTFFKSSSSQTGTQPTPVPVSYLLVLDFSADCAYQYVEELSEDASVWALMMFDVPVTSPLVRFEECMKKLQGCTVGLVSCGRTA